MIWARVAYPRLREDQLNALAWKVLVPLALAQVTLTTILVVRMTFGKGLAQGLAVTLRTMLRRSATAQYPDKEPELPPRSRGVIALQEENCTSCMLCARECPSWCIYIDSHKETIPATTEGGRDRSQNVLDRFDIDYSICMYCSICIEVCPFDALHWSPEFAYAEGDIVDLTHDMNRLREWMWTVPPPPALEAGSEESKELASFRQKHEEDAGEPA